MANKVHIKKGDRVKVIAGKYRNQEGKVLRIVDGQEKAIVENINFIKRHTRPNQQQGVQGGILEREAPIHLSNLMLICPETGKPTRVGRTRLADGKGARVSKVSGATLS